jgi:hypothetical protein
MTDSRSQAEPDAPVPRFATVDRIDVVLAAVLVAAVLLVAAMLIVAAPLGGLLLPNGGFRFFPSILHLVYRKPSEQMRYLLAIAFVLGLGLVFAYARVPHAVRATPARRAGVRLASIGGQLAIVGVAAWSWWAQFHYTDGEPPTTHFGNSNLIVAIAIAGAIALLVRLYPRWLDPRAFVARRPQSWAWFAIAALLTACWLLPSVFRAQNLAPASLSVTYHLQFTFDDFAALVNGRTPLVNYAEQYSSLLPFLVWPVFRVAGTQVGTFTATMCLLSLISLLAVERVLALVARNERVALALYVPFLATSLFFILRSGSQLFSWASYYAVFPMRYAGPYVLLWLCVRHIRGLRPRSPVVVFAFAGLVVLNNIEFGLPAFLAALVAIFVGTKPEIGRFMRLVKETILGLAGALAIVSVLTLLTAGQLPDLGLLTLYSRIFGEGGFGLLPTPVGGLYLIIDMTFAAAILVAGLRFRSGTADSAYTAALVYSGIFGLGAGNYYMGRTHPGGLVVLFSIWSLSVVLLALLALRALIAQRGDFRVPSLLLLAGALVSLGLASTAVAQFPAPWTQLRRIAASAPLPPPYDVSSAVSFLRRTAAHGEPIVLLAPLGHLIAFDAGVENVSPYSSQEDIVTYQQLQEELRALQKAGGKRFYTVPTYPEIGHTLTSDGFTPLADPSSGITEWRH